MSELRNAAAVATATKCSLPAVTAALQPILDALDAQGLLEPYIVIAALATVATECSFVPECEKGDAAYFTRYDGRLGNVCAGDGFKYRGRGFIQITGRANYAKYGAAIGVDLVGNPDLALQIPVAVKVLAAYFADHGFKAHCTANTLAVWQWCRKAVNGGYNGWVRFYGCVKALLAIYAASANE